MSAHPPDICGVSSVLMVCLGNICRSPLAQGVLEHMAHQRGLRHRLTIASRGTGHWHVGDPPDPRSIAVAKSHGVTLSSRGRQLDTPDFGAFDLVLAMDRSNLKNIARLAGVHTPGMTYDRGPVQLSKGSRAHLFLEFAPPELAERYALEVPDPYTGGPEGFEEVYQLVEAGCQGVLDAVLRS